MGQCSVLASVLLWIYFLHCTCAFSPKPGRQLLTLRLNAQNNHSDTKWMVLTLGKGATIDFSGTCSSDDLSETPVTTLTLSYHLLATPCARLLDNMDSKSVLGTRFTVGKGEEKRPVPELRGTKMIDVEVLCSNGAVEETFKETEAEAIWKDDEFYQTICREPNATTLPVTPEVTTKPASSKQQQHEGQRSARSLLSVTSLNRSKRALSAPDASHPDKTETESLEIVCSTRTKNVYALVFHVKDTTHTNKAFSITIEAEMKNTWGYLSALDYPLLIFYTCMTAVYVVYACVWLIAMMRQCKDLLCVQFWIGAVIGLGMIENVLFFIEYNAVNMNGREHLTILTTAEFISAARSTLTRLLIVVISLGVGVVQPRLSRRQLAWIIGIGLVDFTAALVLSSSAIPEEGYLGTRLCSSFAWLLVVICIWVWVFVSLRKTMHKVRVSQNMLLSSLYRYFLWAIIFTVVAFASFSLWHVLRFDPSKCIKDWKDMWLSEGCWPILFSFLLVTMMILWRPTADKTRYAYSPLVKADPNADDPFDGIALQSLDEEKKSDSSPAS